MKRAASTTASAVATTRTKTKTKSRKASTTSSPNVTAAAIATTTASSSSNSSPYFKKLPKEFFDQDPLDLCKALLGKVIARKLSQGDIIRGTIVETEAYPGNLDKASRSYQGKQTEGNAAMFMAPATSFVYLTYGMYHMLNISCRGNGSACLIRAIEPVEYYEIMHTFREQSKKKKDEVPPPPPPKEKGRGKKSKKSLPPPPPIPVVKKKPLKIYELGNGPGKLCLALDIRRDNCDKLDLSTSDVMWLENSEDSKYNENSFSIESLKRVGIDSAPQEARDQLWRFSIENNFAVSTAKPAQIKKMLSAKTDSNGKLEESK